MPTVATGALAQAFGDPWGTAPPRPIPCALKGERLSPCVRMAPIPDRAHPHGSTARPAVPARASDGNGPPWRSTSPNGAS